MTVFEKYRDAILDVWPEAEEVERVKNTSLHRIGRDENGRDLFKMIASPGPMFYEKKGDGSLLDIKDLIKADRQQGYASKVEPFGYILRIKDDGSRRFYPRAEVLSEYIDFARPQQLVKDTYEDIQWKQTPTTDENTLIWIAPNVEMRIDIRENKVKVSFYYASPDDVLPLRLPFVLTGLSRVGREILSTATDVNVGYLNGPTVQAKGLLPGEAGQSITSEKLTSREQEITIDTKTLEGPVIIDPTYTLAASSDDGYWDDQNGCGYTTGNAFCYIGMSGCYRSAWLRYVLTIDNAATISAASIDFANYEGYNETPANINFTCDLSADPSIPTSNTDANARTKGSNVVNWLPATWANVDDIHTSPDISSVIQEIVNQGGFANGNHAIIYLIRNSSFTYNYRQFESYDGAIPAVLSVTLAATASPFFFPMMVT